MVESSARGMLGLYVAPDFTLKAVLDNGWMDGWSPFILIVNFNIYQKKKKKI